LSHSFPRRRSEKGCVLLAMLLFVALLGIAAVAMAPPLVFQLRRDREEEMVHRGVQYSRAIRRYYKKFGRYPSRVEDLESSNNMRFLRRRYKDPITGKDFKLLHLGEVQVNFSGGIAGATPAGNMNMRQGGGSQVFVNQGLPGGAMQTRTGGIGLVGTPNQQQNTPPQTGSDENDSDSGGSGSSDTSNKAPKTSDDDSQSSSQSGFDFSKSGGSNQVFGGSPIVGVTSTSTEATIREYSNKKHYNEWQFIYDPSMDRGGLLTAPGLPKMGGGGLNPQQPGGAQGQGQTPGQPSNPSPPPQQGNQGGNDNDDND
jgi:type II secretory pathway pseudopilin PulG